MFWSFHIIIIFCLKPTFSVYNKLTGLSISVQKDCLSWLTSPSAAPGHLTETIWTTLLLFPHTLIPGFRLSHTVTILHIKGLFHFSCLFVFSPHTAHIDLVHHPFQHMSSLADIHLTLYELKYVHECMSFFQRLWRIVYREHPGRAVVWQTKLVQVGKSILTVTNNVPLAWEADS